MVYVLQEASRRRNAMQMEILYFDGCPTYLQAEKSLRGVLEEEGLDAEVELVAVNTDEEAQELRFPAAQRSMWTAATCSPCRSGRSTR
jgi:hypothetical protein